MPAFGQTYILPPRMTLEEELRVLEAMWRARQRLLYEAAYTASNARLTSHPDADHLTMRVDEISREVDVLARAIFRGRLG